VNIKETFLKEINNGILRGAQATLAKKLDVSPPSVMRWFSGEQVVSEENIKKMSKIFKKSEEEIKEIFGVHKENPNIEYLRKIGFETMLIPIMGTSSATKEKFILEEKEGYLSIKKSNQNQFAIKVEGDCMVDPDDHENSIYHGQYVIVDPDVQPINGNVVVARIDREYSTIKRMFVHNDTIKLIPDNPKCQTIEKLLKDIKIVGKVINVIKLIKTKQREFENKETSKSNPINTLDTTNKYIDNVNQEDYENLLKENEMLRSELKRKEKELLKKDKKK
jgi:SOS-response transcriptional repressor LexA